MLPPVGSINLIDDSENYTPSDHTPDFFPSYISPISEFEVKAAIKSLKNEKAQVEMELQTKVNAFFINVGQSLAANL